MSEPKFQACAWCWLPFGVQRCRCGAGPFCDQYCYDLFWVGHKEACMYRMLKKMLHKFIPKGCVQRVLSYISVRRLPRALTAVSTVEGTDGHGQ